MLSQRHHQTTPRRPHRQGIILLLVLGMLALFSLLAATYVVFTSRSRVASESIGRRENRRVNDDALFQMSMQQVLSGPPLSAAADSALWGHDLLGDYYGTDSLPETDVQVANAATLSALPEAVERMLGVTDPSATPPRLEDEAQFLKFAVMITNRPQFQYPTAQDDVLTGRTLTFTVDGSPLQGMTLPIMRHLAPNRSGGPHILVVDFSEYSQTDVTLGGLTQSLQAWVDSGDTADVGYNRPYGMLLYQPGLDGRWGNAANSSQAGAPGSDDIGWQFRINPRIRNGKGYGWVNSGSGFNLNEDVLTAPAAQSSVIDSVAVPVAFQGNHPLLGTGSLPVGDTDEPFDVADYHDWLLAYFPPNSGATNVGVPAPSGIRPAMLNYLLSQVLAKYGTPSGWKIEQKRAAARILQRATLRPIPTTGPTDLTAGRYANFTGSNLAPVPFLRQPIDLTGANPDGTDLVNAWRLLITGPWDVDSDGDGVTDAVWMDLGLPVTTMPDGTLCRPMVALRIEDLDNRIDINTASSAFAAGRPDWDNTGNVFTGGNPTQADAGLANLPTTVFRGFGYGPAEIPLATIFRRVDPKGDALRLFLAERYGKDGLPGKEDAGTATFDKLGRFRSFGRTAVHNMQQFVPPGSNVPQTPWPNHPGSEFGFMLDTHGRSVMALDAYGAGRYQAAMQSQMLVPWKTAVVDDNFNDPYEMDLYGSGGPDKPVTVAELEPVLRYRDWDRDQLPDRLVNKLQLELKYNRSVPDQQIDERTLTAAVTSHSSTSSLPSTSTPPERDTTGGRLDPMARLALEIVAGGGNRNVAKFAALFPPEIRRGGRMNLNRPFGNGSDDHDSGEFDIVADDPEELIDDPMDLAISYENILSAQTATSKINVNFQDSRILFARHLYSLMMLATSDASNTTAYRKESGASGAEKAEARARRLAQWAVNVVDYRDRDAIMTGFEYDENPLNGWDVDGDLSTSDANSGIVWGYEGHDLLLTESFAYHDRRVRDTAQDDGGSNPKRRASATDADIANADDDTDQYRLPQGSLFLELYSPRGPKEHRPLTDNPDVYDSDMHQWAPPELYSLFSRKELYPTDSVSTSDRKDMVPVLDLGRLAPDGNPVWRIGIGPQHPGGTGSPNSQLTSIAGDPTAWDAATYDPKYNLDRWGTEDTAFKFDRVIWFTNVDPLNNPHATSPTYLPSDSVVAGATDSTDPRYDDKIYYNRFNYSYPDPPPVNSTNLKVSAGPYLQGGQYTVVGPRRYTYAGSQTRPEPSPPIDDYQGQFVAKQRFELSSSSFNAFVAGVQGTTTVDKRITPTPRNTIRSVVGVLAAANLPPTWSNANQPSNTDTAPQGIGINISEPVPSASYYVEPSAYLNPDPNFQDILGYDGYPKDTWTVLPDEPFDSSPGRPLADGGMLHTGTYSDVHTAYLQRLADPTQRYHAQTNPYITVDWHPLDLTVYTGEDTSEQISGVTMGTEWTDPVDDAPFANAPQFGTRFKDGTDLTGVQQDNVLWSYGTREPVDSTQQFSVSTPGPDGYSVYFPYQIADEGDWNGPTPTHPTLPTDRTLSSQTLGYLNFAFGKRTTNSTAANPMATAAGVNYTNEMWEGAPEQPFPWITMLNRDFANPLELMLVPASSPDRLMLEFSMIDSASLPDAYDVSAMEEEFGHLLNFFWSDDDPNKAPNLNRIFDLVETPEPFDSNHKLLGSERFEDWVVTPPVNAREQFLLQPYGPPQNLLVNPGRRGRININTVNNPLVWRELMHAHSETAERLPTNASARGAFWDEWMLSRRGFATPKGAIPNLNEDFPTQFAGHLGPAESAWVAPRLTGAAKTDLLRRTGVDATLMRKAGGSSEPDKPLFVREGAGADAVDRHRNAFFRYQTLMRMKNLVSDNSNTFAVWVTLGYFETNVNNIAEVGKEYGYDAGQNNRKRAFFIIDRSVPVTYMPGEETDIQKTILLSRKLE